MAFITFLPFLHHLFIHYYERNILKSWYFGIYMMASEQKLREGSKKIK